MAASPPATSPRHLEVHKSEAITVRLNSPGGEASEGAAIYNLLRAHDAPVTIEIIGLAASAASIIAMAGEPIRMAENALMMIHEPWVVAAGDADDMRAASERLDKDAIALAKTYARRTGKSTVQVRELMRAETWMTADEAIADSFADVMIEAAPPVAAIDTNHLTIFQRIPERAAAFLRPAAAAAYRAKKETNMTTNTISTSAQERDAKDFDALKPLQRHRLKYSDRKRYDRMRAAWLASMEPSRPKPPDVLRHDGKAYEDMANMERHALLHSDSKLFDQLRRNAVLRGAI